MKELAIIIIALLLFQEASACSCDKYLVDLPIEEMGLAQYKLEEKGLFSDLIFTGILIDYYKVTEETLYDLKEKRERTMYEIVFKLVKSYKGEKNDTIKIRTNLGGDACGYGSKVGTESLIFANHQSNGFFYTYSTECCKSMSSYGNPKRYTRYIKFLESITNMTDGDYNFKQAESYWDLQSARKLEDNLDLFSYSIKNGKFDGEWKITNKLGTILEQGTYKNGLKVGTWKYIAVVEHSDYSGITKKTEFVTYKNGKPQTSKTISKLNGFFGESEEVETTKTYKY